MAKKKYKVNILSKSSVDKLKQDLLKYKNDLDGKLVIFCEKLAEIGVQAAQAKAYESPLGHHVSISVNSEKLDGKYHAYVTAIGDVKNSEGHAPFNTLLAIEFGAGIYHNKTLNPNANELGYGPGTFPGQIHAFEDGWYYWDEQSQEWHYTHGVKATMPMYNAFTEILDNVKKIAKEVFD